MACSMHTRIAQGHAPAHLAYSRFFCLTTNHGALGGVMLFFAITTQLNQRPTSQAGHCMRKAPLLSVQNRW